jgi:hypothetical protein
MAVPDGLFYSVGRLCHLTQKIVGKDTNKGALSALRALRWRSVPVRILKSITFEDRPDGLEASQGSAFWGAIEQVY